MGPGGSSGAPRRFSGHGFTRTWASDSIAQRLFLLISLRFYSLFSCIDSNCRPGGSLGTLGGGLGGPGGSSGLPRRFSGYGFNRALAFDSIARGLFLLISQPFYSLFLYMDSNGDPGWSLGALWGSWRVLRRFTGHEFNRWRGTWSLREGLGTSWKTLRRPLASGSPQGF